MMSMFSFDLYLDEDKTITLSKKTASFYKSVYLEK